MNTEDKDIKNEVDEDSTMPIEEDENTNDVVNDKIADEKSEEKKHSNKKTVLIVLGGFIVFCVAAMIITGGWNPFKSRTVEEEAVKKYEESSEVANDVWTDLNPEDAELDKNSSYYKELQAEFGPDGEFPYGFEILEDNGKEGKDGVLKSMVTANTAYFNKYGFDYTVYYMKNKDYANEKYNQLKNGDDGVNDFRKEYSFSNGKITIAQRKETGLTIMSIKINTVVYYMEGYSDKSDNAQELFNKLNIDFTLPDLKSLG